MKTTRRTARCLGFVLKRQLHNKVGTVDDAMKHVKSGHTILCGGFGLCGIPETLFTAISKRLDIKDLTCVSNNAGLNGIGLDKLVNTGQVSKLIMSYLGQSKSLMNSFLGGKIEIELIPQGTIAERCRAASAGQPAFYTATGVGTWVEQARMPVRYDENGTVTKYSSPKETRVFGGKKYLLEYPLYGDIALVKCWRADTLGNLCFRGTTGNFNITMAKAAKYTIAEADEIVQPGEIDPNAVQVPSIHVDMVIPSTDPKHIEKRVTASDSTRPVALDARSIIAKRAAQELVPNTVVNLGVGLPTLIPCFMPCGTDIMFQSENGFLGIGPYPNEDQVDADIINAGKETVTLLPGASTFSSDESFAMIRAGKIHTTVLGAMEVSQFGDLANWGVASNIKGMGGAMDLVSNPDKTRVIVCTTHTTKSGKPKIVKTCSNPLTGARVVKLIVTELAVFEVHVEKGLTLIELQPGIALDEVRAKTDADFLVALKLPKARM